MRNGLWSLTLGSASLEVKELLLDFIALKSSVQVKMSFGCFLERVKLVFGTRQDT